jgi:hypothetical protein
MLDEQMDPGQDAEETVEDSNPAKRLHALIEPVLAMHNDTNTLEAWAHCFGLDSSHVHNDPHEVTDRLKLLRTEIKLVRSLMQSTSFSADLYENALVAVTHITSVSNLSAPWGHLKGHVSSENLLAIRWCAQAIASEAGLTRAELGRILDSIAEFRTAIEQDNLPSHIRDFVLRQIAVLERGISQYPIRGPQAVRDAVREARVDVLDGGAEIMDQAPRPLMLRLASLWNRSLVALESGEKMIKAITGVSEGFSKIAALIPGTPNS